MWFGEWVGVCSGVRVVCSGDYRVGVVSGGFFCGVIFGLWGLDCFIDWFFFGGLCCYLCLGWCLCGG